MSADAMLSRSTSNQAPRDEHAVSQPLRKVTDEASRPQAELDSRLIAAAAGGDRAAFRTLYDRHLDAVSHHVGRILGPRADREDVVQEVFVQVYNSLGGFRGDCAFSTWLYRITYNVSVSHIRKLPRTIELDAWRPLRCDRDGWARLEARDLLRVAHAALDQVSTDHKEAFLLHETEGMKLREIAELTGESINTIAARVRRTRQKLQQILEQNMPEGGHE